ncbi:MAG TPA: glucokinase, partial [Patescibacteria group bacterium]|nr:glucokinase [Patescibacteria group bacterium]
MIVLAGDIGGTKVDLGLFEDLELREKRRYVSRDFTGLEAILSDFMVAAGGSRLSAAAFGIAGPIVGGGVHTTNLPWVIDQDSLQRTLGCPVAMVNDLESTAHGIPLLGPGEIVTLNEGSEVAGAARAIIAAGTGLGQGYMIFDRERQRYQPRASEGGHTDFAARDDAEIELLRRLASKFGHVSAERVLSGSGVGEILDHLTTTGRYLASRELRDAIAAGDAAAVIARAAMDRTHPICIETMRMFVSAYGAEAGNLALKVMALGG